MSLDLETQHSEHISLDATPPRFLTVGYLGIVDRPVPWNLSAFATVDADYESAKDAYSGLARLNIDDDASVTTGGVPPGSDELFIGDTPAFVGASGRQYLLVDSRTERGQGARGRSMNRRWQQQAGYYESGSRGSSVSRTNSEVTSAASPYKRDTSTDNHLSKSLGSTRQERRRNVKKMLLILIESGALVPSLLVSHGRLRLRLITAELHILSQVCECKLCRRLTTAALGFQTVHTKRCRRLSQNLMRLSRRRLIPKILPAHYER